MKLLLNVMKILLPIFTLTFLLLSCKKDEKPPIEKIDPPISSSQNLNFENWEIVTQNAISYEELSGGFWATLNPLAKLNGPITVVKTNDAQNGNYAALLETKTWGNITIPGLLVVGTFLTQDPFIFQGKPYTKKLNSINGYYKYFPQNGDTAIIYSKLSKFNATKGHQDTIADGSITITTEVSSYQFFNLALNYYSNEQPDSLTIVFVSSIQGANFQGQNGSKLFIDNVSLIKQP